MESEAAAVGEEEEESEEAETGAGVGEAGVEATDVEAEAGAVVVEVVLTFLAFGVDDWAAESAASSSGVTSLATGAWDSVASADWADEPADAATSTSCTGCAFAMTLWCLCGGAGLSGVGEESGVSVVVGAVDGVVFVGTDAVGVPLTGGSFRTWPGLRLLFLALLIFLSDFTEQPNFWAIVQ